MSARVEFEVVERSSRHGAAFVVDSTDVFFADIDLEVATVLPPGRYIVIPVEEGTK